jgi:hypothetical protein
MLLIESWYSSFIGVEITSQFLCIVHDLVCEPIHDVEPLRFFIQQNGGSLSQPAAITQLKMCRFSCGKHENSSVSTFQVGSIVFKNVPSMFAI